MYPSANNQTIPAQQQPFMNPPVVFASEEEQQAQDEVNFLENIYTYRTYAVVNGKSVKGRKKPYRFIEIDNKTKNIEICIACFLISSVQKVTTKNLGKDAVNYQVTCKYFSHKEGKEQSITVSVPKEILHTNELIRLFRDEFGDEHIPFVSKLDKNCSDYLSDYIIQKYQQNPDKKEVFKRPITEDISELDDTDKKYLTKDFYDAVYHNASVETKLLLSAGFGAVCIDKLEELDIVSGTPHITKAIIVYGCQNAEKQRYTASLASVLYDDNQIKKLSEIRVTSKKDELKNIFFEKQYQVLFFEDDYQTSNYSAKQNIGKIQRITEYVSSGITSQEMYPVPCTAVIFTKRKLSEFKEFADDCIFLDAGKANINGYNTEKICGLVTNFLSLLYRNMRHFLKDDARQIKNVLHDYPDIGNTEQSIIDIYNIYQFIVKSIFSIYGIDTSEKEEDIIWHRNKRSEIKELNALISNGQLLDENRIVSQFVDNLNSLMKKKQIAVKAYDKSLMVFNANSQYSSITQAFLYEHESEELLLFSNNDFEKQFSSPAVDMKTLREILSSHHCMTINYSEKSCFRMPIDERKLYAAVKISCLKKEFIAELPQLHPIFTPNLNDGTKRILLGDDEHGNPLYWSLKQENRSVLIQGNTRMGKTYFTTTRLIMGLHQAGCNIIVFESAAPSYSEHELKKCHFDDKFIAMNFYYGKAETASEIIREFETHKNRVYIVSNLVSDSEKQKLCDLIFKYQQESFNATLEQTHPLFVVFEEAGDGNLYDTAEVKRIYNQGSKLKLSVITILQMFIGKGSQKFRRMARQASLKVSFRCSKDHVKYFTDSIPPERRAEIKNKLTLLDIGEAVVCGDFENPEGKLEAGCFLIKA
ncbi:MAG: hypothetical protein IJ642_11660 [Oscillospiraceae bacterium]|nr:hypothetical protein [Oscillospiraceae bacterium]